MKKIAILIVALVTLSSCNNKSKWEYKVVKVDGQPTEVDADFSPLVFSNQTPMLNKMGSEGWELVNIYTETNTSYTNFGNTEYVTGIRENTRTAVINFVFKRPM